jgi:hypothetical protein
LTLRDSQIQLKPSVEASARAKPVMLEIVIAEGLAWTFMRRAT